MSRIRVLNLPRNLNEDEVRRFFTSKLPQGTPSMDITDVCLKKDRNDETKTRMLFVGFKTAAAGAFAVKHFNQAYFKSAKLAVETAAGLGDAPLSHKEKLEQRAQEQEERKKKAAEKRERDANTSTFADPNKHTEQEGALSDWELARKKRRDEFIKERTDKTGGPSWSSELLLPGMDSEGQAKDGKGAVVDNSFFAPPAAANADEDNAYKPQHARNIEKAKNRRLKDIEAAARKAVKTGTTAEDDGTEDLTSTQEALATVADDDFLSSLMGGGGGGASTAAKATPSSSATRANSGAANDFDDEDDDDNAVGAPSSSHSQAAPSESSGIGFGSYGTGDDMEESEEDVARISRRVRVANLPYTATSDDLRNYVSSQVGSIAEIHVPMTRDTKESKGAAFVLFHSADDAVSALTKLKGSVFMGRLLRISAARPDPHASAREAWQQTAAAAMADGDTMDGSGASFKARKLAQQKAADSKGLSWSTTYMSTSAAVQGMADRLKVDASQIVSVDSSGAAVRAAVAEAFLTSEAKAILGDEGIAFDAITDAALHKARSNTTILVKNLSPSQTKDDSFMAELIKMFRKFGTLETIASPSSRLFALFCFLHPQDAHVAFQRLSYKKFNGAPLFLEWAPLGCLKDDEVPLENSAMGATNNLAAADGAAAIAKHQPQFSLYVTNLPKGSAPVGKAAANKNSSYVTEESFTEFICEHCPKVARDSKKYVLGLRILTEKGQAFISCVDKATQQYLLAKLNGRELGGRTLKVEISTSIAANTAEVETSDATANKAGAASNAASNGSAVPHGCDPHKVIVKNLPFEATEKDLRELFAAFNDVKSVRVPKRLHKFGAHRENNHRGFGFVEFLTEQEAANAIRTLSATHLYGRHLVLQYAKKDDSGMD